MTILWEEEYTPFEKAFDKGNACGQAIYNYKKDRDTATCGHFDPYNNGNGLLIRILPALIFCFNDVLTGKYGPRYTEALTCVETVGSLTRE